MNLTTREETVLACIARGMSDREIAARLSFSVSTARKHREHLLAKMQLRKSSQLTMYYLARHRELFKKAGRILRIIHSRSGSANTCNGSRAA
ncbi:LuxR C-terminal-related transcriptional regulator [Cupriavidus necator]|uniref:response regulator transcription factor n=1 Tax=Cupriavidus necator TaxID=106590 RepID=UPI00339D7694